MLLDLACKRFGSGVPVGGSVELSGSDLPILLLLQFLTGLGTTGRVDLWDQRAVGIVYFESGQVVGGIFGPESGLPALEAIALVLQRTQFSFSDRPRPPARNVAIETAKVLEHLERLTENCRHLRLPALEAIPRPLACADGTPEIEPLTNHDLARVLRAVDGGRTVAELGDELGLSLTLMSLAELEALQLISICNGRGRPGPTAYERFVHRLHSVLRRT